MTRPMEAVYAILRNIAQRYSLAIAYIYFSLYFLFSIVFAIQNRSLESIVLVLAPVLLVFSLISTHNDKKTPLVLKGVLRRNKRDSNRDSSPQK